ncbi:MAG: M43 family zinc metalloprotease [Polyangiaceae bacterium]
MPRPLSRSRFPLLVLLPISIFAPVFACSDADVPATVQKPTPVLTDAATDTSVEVPDAEFDAGPDAAPYEGPAPYDGGPTVKPQVVDLGIVASGVPISVQIPAKALGFHVMVESSVPSELLAITSVQAPNGEFFHDKATPAGGDHPTSETILGSTAAVQVPQRAFSQDTVEQGTWKVVFAGPGTLRAKVQIQTTPDGVFHGGNLNLNVYLPAGLELGGKSGITAKNAYANSEVRGRIDGFFAAIWQLYGLRNGTVRFFDIPSKFREIEDNDLLTVFKESKVAPHGQAINIVLSQVGNEGFWWGIAAGVPGAANSPGNDQSGLALASVPEASADMEAWVLAHEAGHFMGLNHTTEFEGGVADPLPDTPRCTTIENGDLESCPDFSNIMFPSGAVSPPIVTSPNQRRVVRGSPMIEAFAGGPAPSALLPPALGQWNPGVLDFGRLFGHAGQPLSRAERLVLAASCGHASHRSLRIPAAQRSDVTRIANDPHAAKPMQGAARRLLAK